MIDLLSKKNQRIVSIYETQKNDGGELI